MMRLGLAVHRDEDPREVAAIARHAEAVGLDELWFIEDLRFNTGPPLAAVALAATSEMVVGTGIIPVTHRHPAVTAMELSTLARLGGVNAAGESRLVAGLGHGVTEWNQWIGESSTSPLTRFDETIEVVRALLAGETVTAEGLHHRVDGLSLDAVPDHQVPLVAGVRGPRSLAAAGRICDGILGAECTGPTAVRAATERAGLSGDQTMRTFVAFAVDDGDGRRARVGISPWLANVLRDAPPPIADLPFASELTAMIAEVGADAALDRMPTGWWHELGAIGTKDDAHVHLGGLSAAGVHTAICFPEPGHAQRDAELMRRAWPD